jgi:hypothetical protein
MTGRGIQEFHRTLARRAFGNSDSVALNDAAPEDQVSFTGNLP